MGPRGRALRPTALSVSWVAACMCPARGQLTDRTREVVAHGATGPARAHLWDRRGHWTNRGGDTRGRSAEAAVVVLALEPSPSQTTRRQWNPLQPSMTGPDGTVTLRTMGRHPQSPAPGHRRRGCDAWPGGDFRPYRVRGVACTFKVPRGECDEYRGDARAQGGGHDSWDPVHHRDGGRCPQLGPERSGA